MNYKTELIKLIQYILTEELPHEKSWFYATNLKERIIEEERKEKKKEFESELLGRLEGAKKQ